MQYHAIAFDYDGTLAEDGHVPQATVEALRRCKASGRRLLLVTGRRLEPIVEIFPDLGLFDLAVVENGALLFWPETREEQLLCEPPPSQFVEMLLQRGVTDLEVGRGIVATWTPHEVTVLDTIRDLGLELQIIFNKGAVMVLPTSVNKATGLTTALNTLGLSPRNTVGVGDAENDVAFLKHCELSAAVDNALASVKDRVDIVLSRPRGAGVVELIDQLIADDFRSFRGRPERAVTLGTTVDGQEIRTPVYGSRILLIGGPASGKSNLALATLEQLTACGYQALVVDPEGDYQDITSAVILGTSKRPPSVEEAVRVVEESNQNCVVSLFGLEHEDQPPMYSKLLRAILELRSRTGRPHWILVDEAHYVAPADRESAAEVKVDELRGIMWITAFPDRLSKSIAHGAELVVAMGEAADEELLRFGVQVDEPLAAPSPPADLDPFHAIAWCRPAGTLEWFRRSQPATEQIRHRHDYWEGDLDEDYRFCFRGPSGALKLSAQNLQIFLQIAEGVDDATWLHHLHAGDYSKWFREVIRDEELAAEVRTFEHDDDLSADGSRARVAELVRSRYLQAV